MTETAVAAPLDGVNMDTDQILPARFLKADRARGYGQFLLHDLRFDEHGRERPEFVLNRPAFRHAQILVADANFGCGSSREGAVYALADFGIRAVVAPSFGDILFNNCLKNGIVPVRLPADVVARLRDALARAPGAEITVSLAAMTAVFPDGSAHPFALDAFWRECLLKGVDEIDLTLSEMAAIEAFERDYLRENDWLAAPL
ncbi:MAG: 3-isopropylmalate dehydratase small subunit [Pseudomonadota bacterium]|nr:3-isopropylmalate dehydratase small subunit [Pseudomonadota bacterium]